MTELAVIDDVTGEITVRPPGSLFHSTDPAQKIAEATNVANQLVDVVRAKKLVVKIGQGEHARVEAWTLLGSLLGVFPVCTWTRKLEDGWEARVEARTMDGNIVGAAEAECLRSEKTWANRDDYALRSMAQTRATSKALRQPLGFVMVLAGFDATPYEEMPREAIRRTPPPPAKAAPPPVVDRPAVATSFTAPPGVEGPKMPTGTPGEMVNPGDYPIHIGHHKGKKISDPTVPDTWRDWVLTTFTPKTDADHRLQEAIKMYRGAADVPLSMADEDIPF